MATAPDKAKLDADFSELYKAHLKDVYSYSYYRVGQPSRRRGPDRADVPAGVPALRARPGGVAGPPAAAVADPHRPQPRGQLLPRPLAPAADQHRRRRARSPRRTRPKGWCEDRDDLARILRGVQQLPDDRREALIMRFALGMDNREIARALGPHRRRDQGVVAPCHPPARGHRAGGHERERARSERELDLRGHGAPPAGRARARSSRPIHLQRRARADARQHRRAGRRRARVVGARGDQGPAQLAARRARPGDGGRRRLAAPRSASSCCAPSAGGTSGAPSPRASATSRRARCATPRARR